MSKKRLLLQTTKCYKFILWGLPNGKPFVSGNSHLLKSSCISRPQKRGLVISLRWCYSRWRVAVTVAARNHGSRQKLRGCRFSSAQVVLQRFPAFFGALGPMLRVLAVVCVTSTLWLQGCDDSSDDPPTAAGRSLW